MRDGLHTPFSDTCELIRYARTQNANGYPATPETPAEEISRREVICQFEEGVSQNEFYLSQKTGLRASASVELWAADYEGEQYVDFAGGLSRTVRHYRVIRGFRSSFDHTTLILEEVVRS